MKFYLKELDLNVELTDLEFYKGPSGHVEPDEVYFIIDTGDSELDEMLANEYFDKLQNLVFDYYNQQKAEEELEKAIDSYESKYYDYETGRIIK